MEQSVHKIPHTFCMCSGYLFWVNQIEGHDCVKNIGCAVHTEKNFGRSTYTPLGSCSRLTVMSSRTDHV